jgi:hypothetical protein
LYRWSADQIDPEHRFDEWREVRSRGLFGVTAELEAEQRANFTGEFHWRISLANLRCGNSAMSG